MAPSTLRSEHMLEMAVRRMMRPEKHIFICVAMARDGAHARRQVSAYGERWLQEHRKGKDKGMCKGMDKGKGGGVVFWPPGNPQTPRPWTW